MTAPSITPGLRCDGCGELLGHRYVSLQTRILGVCCAEKQALVLLNAPEVTPRDHARALEVVAIAGFWARLGALLVLLALGATGCGGSDLAWNGDPAACTFVEAGACYVVDSGQPTATAAWVARARAEAERVLHAPGLLSGYQITLAATRGEGICTIGCNEPMTKAIRLWLPTAEHLSVLVHEAAHEVLDRDHTDPRWLEVQAAEATFGMLIRAALEDEDHP